MDEILKYFPGLSQQQLSQLQALDGLYADWNAKINVISRKDIGNLYPNHVLHSLAIAKFLDELKPGTSFLDLGTGGGFPGIPLAIVYPQCKFHLIDRIGKKIRVAQEVASAIGLENVSFQHGDAGECHEKFDYAVSRAVMPLNELVPIVKRNITRKPAKGNRYAPGLICLKGGDIATESIGIKEPIIEVPLAELISAPQFDQKSLIYVVL